MGQEWIVSLQSFRKNGIKKQQRNLVDKYIRVCYNVNKPISILVIIVYLPVL
jgi:hypothetical protein